MKNKCSLVAFCRFGLMFRTLVAVSALFPVWSVAESSNQPNVILIMADDVGVEGFNIYGGEYFTPNIDAMARDGVRFENAHATPVCTPTRTRLMTGRENARNYKAFGYLDPKEKTFAHAFKNKGYVTGITGKWQLSGNGFDGLVGMTPSGAGFDESFLWQVISGDAKGSRYWGPTISENEKLKRHESGFGPELLNEFALDFIDRHKDQPFFLYYPMVLPHDPFVPTPDSPRIVGDKKRFAAMMTYMDEMVGNVVDKLRSLGLDDNTLVIFTSDNGTNKRIVSYRNGHAVRGEKGLPTLSGTHVPMVFSWPDRLPANEARSGLFDIMDIFPTLVEVAGLDSEGFNLDGVSQLPVIRGEEESARDWIFMHYAPGWIHEPARIVFDQNWKLYGDGQFVALNSETGEEKAISDSNLSSTAKDRREHFQDLMKKMGNVPLDQRKYPMCNGKPSLEPGISPVIAGCKRMEHLVEARRQETKSKDEGGGSK